MSASVGKAGSLNSQRPWATLLLVGALIVAAGIGGISTDIAQLHRLGARQPILIFNPPPQQLVMPLFLHYGMWHWACNSILLAVYGLALERRSGGAVVLYTFFLSGISSVLVSCWVHPQATLVGCSGAVFGLWAAYCAACWWPPGHPEKGKILGIFGLGLVLSASPLAVGSIPVDQSAHLGGAAAGALAYAAYRLHWATRVLAASAVLGWMAWVSRGPHSPF